MPFLLMLLWFTNDDVLCCWHGYVIMGLRICFEFGTCTLNSFKNFYNEINCLNSNAHNVYLSFDSVRTLYNIMYNNADISIAGGGMKKSKCRFYFKGCLLKESSDIIKRSDQTDVYRCQLSDKHYRRKTATGPCHSLPGVMRSTEHIQCYTL